MSMKTFVIAMMSPIPSPVPRAGVLLNCLGGMIVPGPRLLPDGQYLFNISVSNRHYIPIEMMIKEVVAVQGGQSEA
jgi:hypothetical protein